MSNLNEKNEPIATERHNNGNDKSSNGKSGNIRLMIAVLLIPWLSVAGIPIISALQNIATALDIPENTVKLLITMPNLTMIVSCLAGGIVVGRRLSYKPHMIIASIIMVISGTAPFFMADFTIILVMRGIFGLGLGFMTPVISSVVYRLYPEEERAKIIGLSSASMFTSSVLYTLLGGYLGSYSWQHVFLIHIAGLIPLIVVLPLLPKLRKEGAGANKDADLPKQGIFTRMPPKCLLFIILNFVFQMLSFPILVNVSFILAELGIESSSTASILLTINTVASAIAGLAFGFIAKAFRRFALPLSLGVSAVGMVVAALSESYALLLIGTSLGSAGTAIMGTALLLEAGFYVKRENIGLFSGVNMAASCIGGFCMTAYTGLLARFGLVSSRSPLMVSGIGVAVLLIIMLAYAIISINLRKKDLV